MRQLELVAVKTPETWKCPKIECTGYIYWSDGDDFPKCKRCGQVYWFREVADAKADDRDGQIAFLECESRSDAKTIAMLEGVVEAAKKGAAKGAGSKTGKIAVARETPCGWDVWVDGNFLATAASTGRACDMVAVINENIAAFEAEVKTLSETIVKKTRQINAMTDDHARLGGHLRDRIAELEAARPTTPATPAPPDDSREAFEEWAVGSAMFDDGGLARSGEAYDDVDTQVAYAAWLAAPEWRGKPKDAEPPADSYRAFEEWAESYGYSIDSIGGPVPSYKNHETRVARIGWVAALERRGKPGRTAETGDTFARTSDAGSDLIVLGGEVFRMHGDGVERAVHLINVACARETAPDGK